MILTVIDNALDAGNAIPDELQHRVELRKAVRETEGYTTAWWCAQLFLMRLKNVN